MEGKTSKLQLTLPEQSRARLTFSEAAPRPFRQWVKGLPMANIGETARRLYQAIIELNQLAAPPQLRLTLLELIRPPTYFVCGELARHYLGHSISLPDRQRKVANLAQALQLHLASGYKQALVDLLELKPRDRSPALIAQAVHRAITDLSSTILRASQLYCPSPAHAWLECHRLFLYARSEDFADRAVEDKTNSHRALTSVTEAYQRLLLLGCCRPNQLRQDELKQAYGLFELWSNHTELTRADNTEALFLIDPDRDTPPFYRSLVAQRPELALGFDTSILWQGLTDTLNRLDENKNAQNLPLETPGPVNETLLMHLSQALGILTKRSFKRVPGRGRLEIAVGLSAAHYFCSGETEFNQFLGAADELQDEVNVFLDRTRRKQDAWSGAHDAGPGDSLVAPDTPINFRSASGTVMDGKERANAYHSYHIPLVDTSPGGYCLNWNESIPTALQTGEVVALREQADHPWSLGIVRWIRQIRQQGTRVGLELLAPNSVPCGVRLIQKVGNSSEYLRALLLPELENIGQPATLITPRLPFRVGSRVVLFHGDTEEQCQLSKRVAATGSVSRFELRFLSRPEPQTQRSSRSGPGTSEDDFDSLWPSL